MYYVDVDADIKIVHSFCTDYISVMCPSLLKVHLSKFNFEAPKSPFPLTIVLHMHIIGIKFKIRTTTYICKIQKIDR